ncbi:MAG: RND transporter, partial [Planctomycetota bacterium]
RIVIEEYKSALRVPSGALFNTVDGQAIFVVRDGEAHKVAIKTGASNGVETLVQSGLSDGEQVIVHPAEEVEEGTSIKSR